MPDIGRRLVGQAALWAGRHLGGGNDAVLRELRPEVQSFLVVALLAVIGALLFGLAHFNPLLGWDNVSLIAGFAAGGVMFGITVRLRRLGSSIFAHPFFNLTSVLAVAALAVV